ncbi:MAG: hypothetical protein JWL60_2532 [Gemmatimonadetes bacterium]|jgi:hypothetical protein|nr:hypothetical protein [Gemmatimonadota bacterium]
MALLLLGSAPLHAQRRPLLDVAPPTAGVRAPVVTTSNLFGDPDMRDLVRSGFPASLRFRLELWRVGGLFNDLERHQDWELIIQYDPSGQRYRVARRNGDRLDDVGSFATLSTAQLLLERPLRVALLPERDGVRYYYNLVLNVEALSVSDMDQVERWLRGMRTDGAASIGSGMRTLMLRMLGGEKRTYEKRSATFVAER